MSTVLKLADGTELPLASAPAQTTAFADGLSRNAYKFRITPSTGITAESVNTLVSNSAKAKTFSV